MKKKYVIDAGALALYFAGDFKVRKYFDEILAREADAYLCEVNLAEFYYKTVEKLGEEVADIRYESVRNSPIRQVPAAGDLTREAAKIKLKYRGKISLADAYLIALALQTRAIALTTDSVVKEILRRKCIFFKA